MSTNPKAAIGGKLQRLRDTLGEIVPSLTKDSPDRGNIREAVKHVERAIAMLKKDATDSGALFECERARPSIKLTAATYPKTAGQETPTDKIERALKLLDEIAALGSAPSS